MAIKLTRAQVEQFVQIKWQDGTVNNPEDVNGAQLEDALGVVLDRLEELNQRFSCQENVHTADHIKAAIDWQRRRTADREARRVEGREQA